MILNMALLVCLVNLIIPPLVTSYSKQEVEYLQEFGYLPKPAPNVAAMLSETMIEEAIRELQLYGKVPVTGKLDTATRELMTRKRLVIVFWRNEEKLADGIFRCGLSDRPVQEIQRRRRRFALMGSKWTKPVITYSVDNPSRSIPNLGTIRREISEAISSWRDALPMQFNEVRPESEADVKIRFAIGDHGDPYRFDGSGRILAHAFPPGEGIGGDIHLDDDERWTVSLTGDPHRQHEISEAILSIKVTEVSLRSIVMHEFGHSIGLSHSQQEDSIMYAFYQYDTPPKLSYDDLLAIWTLYSDALPGGDYDPKEPSDTPPPQSPTTTAKPPLLPREPEQPTDQLPTIHPASPEAPIPEPDPCKVGYDAIASIRQEIFVFKVDYFFSSCPIDDLQGSSVWTLTGKGMHMYTSGQMVLANTARWYTKPKPTSYQHFMERSWMAGKDIYIFEGQHLVAKKTLADFGLPTTVEQIRLAYTWNYWTEQPMYIWTKDEFWRVDKKSGKVEIGYPRKIATTWHGIPEEASAAVTYNNDLYFFTGNEAYKFHTINMTAAPPISTSQLWSFCPVVMKISGSGNVARISSLPTFTIVIIFTSLFY